MFTLSLSGDKVKASAAWAMTTNSFIETKTIKNSPSKAMGIEVNGSVNNKAVIPDKVKRSFAALKMTQGRERTTSVPYIFISCQ